MLKVSNLCKSYDKFKLSNVSFELPSGFIMGFIGANGAGKTTTLKSILNIVKCDSGQIEIFGKSIYNNESEIKEQIGFSAGNITFYPKKRVRNVVDIYKRFYKNWSDEVFSEYTTKFKLDEEKRINALSQGMCVKLSIALALSHDAKLIILDEPTSGLDPIAREELLSILSEIISDGDKSVLFSTHITSDLDKCADYILFIKDGKIIENSTKDDLIDAYALISGKMCVFNDLQERLVGYKKNAFGFQGLIKRSQLLNEDDVEIAVPNVEDIMIYHIKEEKE